MPLYLIEQDRLEPGKSHRHLFVTRIENWGVSGSGEIVNTDSPQGVIRYRLLQMVNRRCETCRVQLDKVVIPK